jgi:hypothetical protein
MLRFYQQDHHVVASTIYLPALLFGGGLLSFDFTRSAGWVVIALLGSIGLLFHVGLWAALHNSQYKLLDLDLADGTKIVVRGTIEAVVEDFDDNSFEMRVREDGAPELSVWGMGGRFFGRHPT